MLEEAAADPFLEVELLLDLSDRRRKARGRWKKGSERTATVDAAVDKGEVDFEPKDNDGFIFEELRGVKGRKGREVSKPQSEGKAKRADELTGVTCLAIRKTTLSMSRTRRLNIACRLEWILIAGEARTER